MASYTVDKTYVCNYDETYNYYDITIVFEKEAVNYAQEQKLIFSASLTEKELNKQIQAYADKVESEFVVLENQ